MRTNSAAKVANQLKYKRAAKPFCPFVDFVNSKSAIHLYKRLLDATEKPIDSNTRLNRVLLMLRNILTTEISPTNCKRRSYCVIRVWNLVNSIHSRWRLMMVGIPFVKKQRVCFLTKGRISRECR